MTVGCVVPLWISEFQALGPPIIALLVAAVAFLQWRTAHQRAVLDLFDRRMAVFESLREVVSEIIRTGNVTNPNIRDFDCAKVKVPFLFSSDINLYLDDLRTTMVNHHALDNRDDENSLNARDTYFAKIGRFYGECGTLLSPYMCMVQKAPPF